LTTKTVTTQNNLGGFSWIGLLSAIGAKFITEGYYDCLDMNKQTWIRVIRWYGYVVGR